MCVCVCVCVFMVESMFVFVYVYIRMCLCVFAYHSVCVIVYACMCTCTGLLKQIWYSLIALYTHVGTGIHIQVMHNKMKSIFFLNQACAGQRPAHLVSYNCFCP